MEETDERLLKDGTNGLLSKKTTLFKRRSTINESYLDEISKEKKDMTD